MANTSYKTAEPHLGLKALCKACSTTARRFTQADLAKAAGVSFRAMVKIVTGERQLTEENANRLMIALGVLPASILDKYGEPLALDGTPYSTEHFKKSCKGVAPQSLALLDKDTMSKAAVMLEALQHAAAKKGRLLSVQWLFQQWLSQTVKDLGLEKDLAGELERRAEQPLDRLPLFELRHGRDLFRYGRRHSSRSGPRRGPGFEKVRREFAKQAIAAKKRST